jgi:hypothetical protein
MPLTLLFMASMKGFIIGVHKPLKYQDRVMACGKLSMDSQAYNGYSA